MVIHGYIWLYMVISWLFTTYDTWHAPSTPLGHSYATRPRPAASAMAFWALTQLRADSFLWPDKEGAMVKLRGGFCNGFMVHGHPEIPM